MLLIKCSLKRLIKLGSNDFTVLFTDQIRINCLYRNTHPSTCFKTHFRAFQILGRAFHTRVQAFKTLGRAFEVLRESQKLNREFEQVDRMFVLWHGLDAWLIKNVSVTGDWIPDSQWIRKHFLKLDFFLNPHWF